MVITHKIGLDLMVPGEMPRIFAVQDDCYCRNLEITLTSGGETWEVPAGAAVLVRFRKSDSTGGEYNTLPDGTSCWTAEGNVLNVALAPQVLTVPGMVHLAVSIIDGVQQVTTFAVGISVKPAVKSLTTASADYVNVMSVGTVEALAYGEEPWAKITGTAENPVLHLGLPRSEGPVLGVDYWTEEDQQKAVEMLAASDKTITIEEKSGGYWDTKEVWNNVEGVYSKRTNLIPVKTGEAFLYSGFGDGDVPSCVWLDSVGNILSYEQYSVENGVRVLTVPANAAYARLYSHTYDIGTENVVLEVVFLPKGDDRVVRLEEKDGGYWDISGQWIESSGGSKRTCPLLISREDRIRYIGYGRWTAASVLWYDADGGIVGSGMYCEEIHNRFTSATLIPPVGAVYARFFSWDAGSLDAVVLGVSFETESDLLERFKMSNVLYGKKYVACGDSFTAGDFSNAENPDEAWDEVREMYKTYPWWIAERNGMTLVNEAVCGSTMYANGEDSAFSVARYKEVPLDADYVTLCFGLNEVDAEIGSLEDSSNETVLGAWNVVLEWLITNLPYAKIGIIVPDGWCTEEIREALISVAEYWGVPYLDLKGDPRVPLMTGGRFGKVNAKAVTLRNGAFQISETDGHPNLKGQEYRATVVEQFLRGL